MTATCTRAVAIAALAAAPSLARADDGQSGVAWGTAAAEVTAAGVVALHVNTASSPARGPGLALNMVPLLAGAGIGWLGEAKNLEPRYPMAFHGAVAGGFTFLGLGAAFDGRNDPTDGARVGPVALTLTALGATAGAFAGATLVDNANETIAFAAAPPVGALAGGIAFAVVHFYDDEGPTSTGRLYKYAGVGALLGVVGSLVYAIPDRGAGTASMRTARAPTLPSLSIERRATLVSFGGAF